MAKQKPSPSARFAKIDHDVLDAPAWAALGPSARALYVDLLRKFNGRNNGDISATLSDLRKTGWSSQHTVHAALQELLALGFIVCTRKGGVARGSSVCSLYGFTHLQINDLPKIGFSRQVPTFGYRLFDRADAERAVREVRARKKTPMQKLHRTDAETAPCSGRTDAVSALGRSTPDAESALGKKRAYRTGSRASAAFQ